MSYADFKTTLSACDVRTYEEWLFFRNQRPEGVPENPPRIYKARGDWISWDDVFSP